MPKFAVYFIPDEASSVYQLGSSLIGYDVRKGQTCLESPLQNRFVARAKQIGLVPPSQENFDLRWVERCQRYGH